MTELPLDVFATIVLPFTLDTVIASHGPFAPGVASDARGPLKLPGALFSVWELLKSPCVKVNVWALLALDCVRAAAWVVPVIEPMIVPMPRASMKARARPPITSHLRPRLRGADG